MQVRTSLFMPLVAAALCFGASPAIAQTAGGLQVQGNNLSAGVDAPPVCDDGGPYNAECAGASTAIPVDASGSFDPDGTAPTFLWFEECAFGFFEDPTSAQTNYVIDMTGVCTRSCVYVVRVTSGGQTTVCGGTATVTDTLPPVITCPGDVTDVWGIDTSPANTGTATAIDACDPAPTISFSDVITPQQGPGVEQIITRTWTAMDSCNHQSTCTQVITLLSPSAGGSLELDAGSCPNTFPIVSSDTTMRSLLLGNAKILVNRVELTSLRLSRPGYAAGGYVSPIVGAPVFPDVARSIAKKLGDCNPVGQDGYKDYRMVFDRAQVISALGLDTLAPGTRVPILLTGMTKTGLSFTSMDVLTVQ